MSSIPSMPIWIISGSSKIARAQISKSTFADQISRGIHFQQIQMWVHCSRVALDLFFHRSLSRQKHCTITCRELLLATPGKAKISLRNVSLEKIGTQIFSSWTYDRSRSARRKPSIHSLPVPGPSVEKTDIGGIGVWYPRPKTVEMNR